MGLKIKLNTGLIFHKKSKKIFKTQFQKNFYQKKKKKKLKNKMILNRLTMMQFKV